MVHSVYSPIIRSHRTDFAEHAHQSIPSDGPARPQVWPYWLRTNSGRYRGERTVDEVTARDGPYFSVLDPCYRQLQTGSCAPRVRPAYRPVGRRDAAGCRVWRDDPACTDGVPRREAVPGLRGAHRLSRMGWRTRAARNTPTTYTSNPQTRAAPSAEICSEETAVTVSTIHSHSIDPVTLPLPGRTRAASRPS